MTELSFKDQVAIVTGAGGNPNLGRSFARLFAARGAKVVVNDLGTGPDGRNLRKADAVSVAREIVQDGGEAVPDLHSVAEEDGARAVVQTAIDQWGRVDIVVNNAGIAIMADFDEISPADIARTVAVHLFGNIWMCRAAWPYMKSAGYGRIVNITSGAFFGGRYHSIYGAAKGGIIGLTRNLAYEGAEYGIKVNTLGPAAGTVAALHVQQDSPTLQAMMEKLPPDKVAPTVAFLAHEQCPCTGRFIEAMGDTVTERVFAQTKGYTAAAGITLEDVRDHWADITDPEGMTRTPDPLPAAVPEIGNFVPKPYVAG
jgi:NAD(P)-dependent dehydrogenase (short-subunit alcohol dehydrogenase family)